MARLSTTALLGAAILIGWSHAAGAADEQVGKNLSDATCVACHGKNGIGLIDLYPNLAGQKREYLAAQLRAFRDGSRKNPIMSPMAAHLADSDIENLAAYFASLK
jgi:cytochrome c553